MPADAARVARAGLLVAAALVSVGLPGCTLPPPASPDVATAPRAAPPAVSAGAPQDALRQEEAACRSFAAASGAPDGLRTAAEQRALARSSVVLATEAGAGPIGTSSTPPTAGVVTRQVVYARCMQSGRG